MNKNKKKLRANNKKGKDELHIKETYHLMMPGKVSLGVGSIDLITINKDILEINRGTKRYDKSTGNCCILQIFFCLKNDIQ